DYLFLCVKPQQLEAAFGEFNDMLRNGQIVVSIAAGVSVERLLKMAKKDVKIVRTMPNTPLLVGCGATAISRPKEISDADYDFVCEIFRSSGDIFEIAPDKFDEVIPVAGSGVAILFRLARLIAESAEREGLDYDSSINMFAKTLEGAAAMIFRSGKPADELEKMVCSKGGTTLALLGKLDEFEFNRAVNEAYGACVARAKELGKQV
ncbi:MAG: pyrroline-5-carboxylate reductase dimerization domain-containing protein, partial [Oscillospiraceae bacterium]